MNEMVNIPGRLHDVSSDHVVSGANEIYDDALNKRQSQINQEIEIPVLSEAPDEDTLTYGTSPNTKNFAINQLCKVADEDNKFTYYRLHNIVNNKAVWVEEGTAAPSDYYNVVIADNQNGEDIANAKLTYNQKQYSNGNKIKVAKDTVISLNDVSATDITNYKKTITIVDKTITVLYQAEKVVVTVNTDEQGITAENQVVTINGTDYTVPSTGMVTAKVPFDTIYSIGVNSWAGQDEYTSPESQTNITANAPTRNITMTYLKVRTKTYNLVVTDDQNGSYGANAEVTVKYTVDGVETTLGIFENGDTFTVPGNAVVNLIGSVVEDAVPEVTLNNSVYTVNYHILAVDLGDGIKWATGNLTKDAQGNYSIAAPTEYGAYFSWGDTEGRRVEGQDDNYTFNENNYNTGVSGSGHNLTTDFISRNPTYDAAKAKLGGDWRTPTYEEYTWLINNCTWTRKELGNLDYNGVAGIEGVGPNGNKIFIPYAGSYNTNGFQYAGGAGHYWTTKQVNSSRANEMEISTNYSTPRMSGTYKYYGISIRPVKGIKEYSYIINQTNPSANPSDIIEIDTPAKDSNDVDSVIHQIHSNTKLYGAQLSLVNKKLQVKEISRTNKAQYTDGTPVDAATTDIFMKLPRFWWKCEEIATNKYKISFTIVNPNDNSWNHWEGNTFIGCYKAYNSSNKVYSRKGVTPTVNVNRANFKTYARNRGAGFRIITYEAQQIMALLGYGWLGTTDAQAIVGRGSTKSPKTTGICDALGMNDTVADVNGGASDGSTDGDVSINFWGLENWWGDISEWMDNLETIDTDGTVKITDINNNTIRTIQVGAKNYACIGQMILSDNGDIIPKEVHSDRNYATGFADESSVSVIAGYVARRSSVGNNISDGLACLHVSDGADEIYPTIGSRLLYQGDYQEI